MERYIEILRAMREQSGWESYRWDDSNIILWLIAPMLVGTILVTLATLFIESEQMEIITSKIIFTLVVVGFVGVLSYLTTSMQVHKQRQKTAVMDVVKNLSTEDYVELQKNVQLYGKKHIDDKELKKISKLLRQEFFPEKSYMNGGD